jgi:hypothetical protein
MNGISSLRSFASLEGQTLDNGITVLRIARRVPVLAWNCQCDRCGTQFVETHTRLMQQPRCPNTACGKRSRPVSPSHGRVVGIPTATRSAESSEARQYARVHAREDAAEFADRIEKQRQAERRASTRPPTPEAEPLPRIFIPPTSFTIQPSDTPSIRAALISLKGLQASNHPAAMPLFQSIREARQAVHQRGLERIQSGEIPL